MRQYPIWLCLSFLGVLGSSLASGCAPTNDVVGKVEAPVDGDPCATAGDKATAADGCNQCTCADDTHWACTDKACTPDPGTKPDPTAPVCKDGEVKAADDGCNKCACEEGAWACTLMDCGGGEPSSCKPGEALKPDECNVCECGDDGNWSCTKMDCGGTPTPSPCKPGETKPDDCNVCSCNADGTGWMCTEKACPVAECKQGDTKEVDCNKCTCTGDGKWACTDIACGGACPPTLITEEGHPYDEKQACIGGDSVYFGCATLDDPTLVIPADFGSNVLCAKLITDGTLFLVKSRVSSKLFTECSPGEGKKVMSAGACP